MKYSAGQVIDTRTVVELKHSLGRIDYYLVKCNKCGHESLMSGTSIAKVVHDDKGCKRCYHRESNQAYGNYRTIKSRKVAK